MNVGRWKILRLMAVTAILSGCSELTEPVARTRGNDGRVAKLQLGDNTYTLNPSARTLTHSDGRVVDLTVDETAQLATVFADATHADSLHEVFAASPPPEPEEEDPYANCMWGGPCATVQLYPSTQPQAPQGDRARGRRPAPQLRRVRQVGQGPARSYAPIVSVRDSAESVERITMFEYADPPSCLDVATAVYEMRSGAVTNKSAARQLLEEVFDALDFDLVGGVLRAEFSLFGLGARLTGVRTAMAHHVVTLNLLAGWYNALGCWERDWTDRTSGPSWGGGGGSSLGYFQLECRDETWEISIDGGETWSPIQVRVCEVVWHD